MTISLTFRVAPRASRTEVVGERDGVWKVRLSAPPVDGAANVELVKLLSKVLDIPKADIAIVSGASSRTKIVSLQGRTQEAAVELLKAKSRA